MLDWYEDTYYVTLLFQIEKPYNKKWKKTFVNIWSTQKHVELTLHKDFPLIKLFL